MAASEPLSLSFVILAWNEEDAIAQAIDDCRDFARSVGIDHEVVVVDDGSRDRTRAIAELEAGQGDVVVVVHEHNRGMGASMRDGYRAATKQYIAHLPGDRQVRAGDLADAAERCAPDSVVLTEFRNPPSGAGRAVMSVVFRALIRHVGGMRVNFAGTYLFHRTWLDRIDSASADSNTFLFSFQLLELFRRDGACFETVAIPTYRREVGTSREATLGRVARMFGEIARARVRRRG